MAPVVATRLRDVARSGARVRELKLSNSPDLVCRQLLCEHVGDACACRLALALDRVPDLAQLDLSQNRLQALPDAVYALASLSTLDVQQNRLTTISSDIAKLTQLQTLDVRHNRLTTLPVDELETLPLLQTLRIRGNDALIQRLQTRHLELSHALRTKIVLD